MKIRKSSLIIISLSLLCLASWMPRQDQDTSILEKKVRMLLAQTGSANMGKDVLDQMMDAFQNQPGLPSGFIAKFKELARPEELIELVVPIYVKHVDATTMDAVIAFNKTPAGKKFIAAMPAITRESMMAGQTWGRELAQRVVAELGR